jgi:hypothetical protein
VCCGSCCALIDALVPCTCAARGRAHLRCQLQQTCTCAFKSFSSDTLCCVVFALLMCFSSAGPVPGGAPAGAVNCSQAEPVLLMPCPSDTLCCVVLSLSLMCFSSAGPVPGGAPAGAVSCSQAYLRSQCCPHQTLYAVWCYSFLLQVRYQEAHPYAVSAAAKLNRAVPVLPMSCPSDTLCCVVCSIL